MGFYRSEKEAAYFALQQLSAYLPETPDYNSVEWGTIIYRFDDPKGGYWYSYQEFYKGDSAEWEPRGRVPNGAVERAYCHTHPNDAPFSNKDVDTASGKTHVYPPCTMYMVTQSGAYWYDGRTEPKLFPRNSPIRYGTMWGLPYKDLVKK
ncbi:MAG TPA: hypothetical protein PKY59_17095 [Pyrinomonadaceae bacterium]|nr:hypothetical protein [Pyrinomonadaceae bacterium]